MKDQFTHQTGKILAPPFDPTSREKYHQAESSQVKRMWRDRHERNQIKPYKRREKSKTFKNGDAGQIDGVETNGEPDEE